MGKLDAKLAGYVIECDWRGHSAYVESIGTGGIASTFYAEDAFIFPNYQSAMNILNSPYVTNGVIKARYALQITQFMDVDA